CQAVKLVLFLCFRWISAATYRVKTQQRSHFDHYSFSVSLCAQGGVSALAALTVNNAEPARGKVFDGFAVYGVVNAIQLQIAPVGGGKVFPSGKLARFFLPLPDRDFIQVSGGFWWSCHVLFSPNYFQKNSRAQKFEQ